MDKWNLNFCLGLKEKNVMYPHSSLNFSDSWLIYFPFISGRRRVVYTNSAPSSKVHGSNIACLVKIIAALIFAEWTAFLFTLFYFIYFIFYHGATSPVDHDHLIAEDSWSHSHTPHLVGLFWTSDQPVAETSTWQHTTLKTNRHPCPRRNSNPQFHQASGRRPTP